MTDPQSEFCLKAYHQQIRTEFSFLKSSKNYQEAFLKAIPISKNLGFLIPISKFHTEDEQLIEKLAHWRAQDFDAYPTQFKVTKEGTRTWLQKGLLDIPDRILFLVCTPFGEPIGHLGYAHCLSSNVSMEIDNVIRGEKEKNHGLMSYALETLIQWANEQFSPSHIHLRVFSDNQHAVSFYEKNSFIAKELIPLKKIETTEKIIFEEILSSAGGVKPDRYFQCMEWAQKKSLSLENTILTAGPLISAKEPFYSFIAAKEGWNRNHSDFIHQFETCFKSYIGVPHALSTSSCTGALHIALKALGLGAGDEVIVPDLTWVATANAVLYSGATPVFADIEKDSWCISPESILEKINARTKAIIPVHLYGHPARMPEIMKIAQKHNLYVLEDAAPAIGAEISHQKVGTFGHFAAFSFQGAKLAVTGEGGVLVSTDDSLYKKAHKIWDQGRRPGTFFIEELGLKYKMSNIQAALGLAQMEKIDHLIALKRKVFFQYEKNLKNNPFLQLNYETKDAKSIYWMTSILLKENAPVKRDEMIQKLKEHQIDSRPLFPAISTYPYWPQKQSPQKNAFTIGENGINLPSGALLTAAHIDYISNVIHKILS